MEDSSVFVETTRARPESASGSVERDPGSAGCPVPAEDIAIVLDMGELLAGEISEDEYLARLEQDWCLDNPPEKLIGHLRNDAERDAFLELARIVVIGMDGVLFSLDHDDPDPDADDDEIVVCLVHIGAWAETLAELLEPEKLH